MNASPQKAGVPTGAWVLVADGEKALFLKNVGDEQDMHLTVIAKEEQDNPKAQEWAANRPGRFNDGPSVHRSAVEDTDWHQLAKERFAADLADKLYKHAINGDFGKIIIVASRPVLSELRSSLHQEVSKRVMLDIPKVLTNHPLDEIERLLSREISGD